MRFPAGMMAAWLGVAGSAVAGDNLRFVHFPDAAYAGENATFVLSGVPGARLQVTLNGREVAASGFDRNVLEVNLALEDPVHLRFLTAESAIDLNVVAPNPQVRLADRDGYLYAGRRPAVLLARHLCPPKHNRRWETVRLVRHLIGDPRPPAASGLLIGAGFLSADEAADLDGLSSLRRGFWRRAGAAAGTSGIHGLICGLGELRRADVVVVGLTDWDQERGMDPLAWAIKLDWYLQALAAMGLSHVHVAPPPLDARQRQQFPYVMPQCRLSALASGAAYVPFHDSELEPPFTGAKWMAVVKREIERTVRCE